ncbi:MULTISPECIES: NAD(P)-binding domain-containing protein [Paenibacillus]|uniref:Uncharacterized protein n=1 Tax=Paenibacillus illinoisensis TaxID=59845 RepID=A0A2W0C4N6_9BACL|nr:NAD(P)-binding domain-containing protein [Paenibacillus illinoisensis]PYY27146.1 Uncharacterized protein PIL02S_04640 [Paenibacillus illinoisensis]
MKQILNVIVIGGGQAGLASGYHLKKRVSFLILEAGEDAAGAWPRITKVSNCFPRQSMHLCQDYSLHLREIAYPHRDEVIQYLKEYSSHFELPLVYYSRVENVSKEYDYFRVETSAGKTYFARKLISATGSYCRPLYI